MSRSSVATDLPTGTVTMLFTDIEGSTRLLRQLGASDYAQLLAEHHRLMRSAIAACDGAAVKTEGDSFFAVFGRAEDALRAAVQAQRDLADTRWPSGVRVAVRMALHTGDVSLSEGEYVGMDIHRAARLAAAGHGGQLLLSETTSEIVEGELPPGVTIVDLAEHRLRDIEQPEHIHQVVIDGLPSEFPPLRAEPVRFEILPTEASAFIGRDALIEQASQLLANNRLLTLTGPGGTGKTRLSLRIARVVGAEFADGVAFIALADLSDPELVAPTIRQTLGLGEQAGRTPLETLAEWLATKQVLLVLDNFEQIVSAAPVVARLLEEANELRIIVTSRTPLHIEGEQELPVPPLSLPAESTSLDPATLEQSESVALFVQRARALLPNFRLTPETARAVAEICARLDGLPLAIELAASRIKLLPPPALLARLGNALDLLQGGHADRTDRQRTLRGAIDWSYSLLSDDEKALFRRLSVFVGGFSLDAAETIVTAAGPLQVDTLEGIGSLLDHSLLRHDGGEAEPRCSMLETIREYGRECLLASAELNETASAHAAHFAELVGEAEPHLTGGPEWADRLERDLGNIRAALEWLGEHDLPLALVTAGRLWRFWHLRGHLREGEATLSTLLADPRGQAGTAARAKALIGLAGIVYWRTDYARARSAYEDALAIARECGDSELEVEVLYSLAYVRAIGRDYEGAEHDFDAARQLYEAQGNQLMATWALESVGMIASLAGDHERAIELIDRSIERFGELGDGFGLRNVLAVAVRTLMHLDRLDRANELNRRVVRLALDQRDVTSFSATLHDAASLAALAGDLEKAAIVTGAAHRVVDETGGEPPAELVNRIEAMPLLERELEPARLRELLAHGHRLTDEEATRLVTGE
jgi:predicted ATPase/class 3 adenylate cyclase